MTLNEYIYFKCIKQLILLVLIVILFSPKLITSQLLCPSQSPNNNHCPVLSGDAGYRQWHRRQETERREPGFHGTKYIIYCGTKYHSRAPLINKPHRRYAVFYILKKSNWFAVIYQFSFHHIKVRPTPFWLEKCLKLSVKLQNSKIWTFMG